MAKGRWPTAEDEGEEAELGPVRVVYTKGLAGVVISHGKMCSARRT
jgi:hypothetical protein